MKDARVQLWNFAPIFTADFRQKIMKNVVQVIFFAWNDFSWMYWEETNREIASPTPNFFHLVDAINSEQWKNDGIKGETTREHIISSTVHELFTNVSG